VPGGVEIVILIAVFMASVAALGVLGARHRRMQGPHLAEVPGTVDDVSQKLAAALSGIPKQEVSCRPGILQITYRTTPLWAICVAILCFPLGLIALIAKSESRGTITLRQVGEHTEMSIAGSFLKIGRDRINGFIRSGMQNSRPHVPPQR
jgi:hypothetical protein